MHARRGPLVAGVAGMSRLSTLGSLVALALLAQACRLPQIDTDSAVAEPLALTSFLYAADGSLITRFHAEQDRVPVTSEQIPEVLRDAVVAIEDRRFFDHRGIDVRAVLRAVKTNYDEGDIVEGGSTITQQYVKNAVVGTERSLARKWREALVAWRLEDEMSKDQILTGYLNTVYFGKGAYGIQAAAKTYFDKPVWKLDLDESALLAGLISAPARYDPIEHPGQAVFRRNTVLVEMLKLGMITREAFEEARAADLAVRPRVGEERYFAPYFVEHFKRWFLSNPRFGDTYTQRYNLLFKGGLRIHTTLDPELQRAAEDAISQILVYPEDPYAAMTVIDPRTGHVKAVVGGRDFFSPTDPVAQVNLATGEGGTGRGGGSSFKLFALVAALEKGITPQTVYGSPPSITLSLPSGSHPSTWSPANYEGAPTGSMTLEQATIDSINTVYAQVVRDLGNGDLFRGAQEMVKVARRMGVRRELKAVPSAVLGANPVTPLDMASAYGPIATGGMLAPPVFVERIEDRDGELLYEAPDRREQVVGGQVAFVVNQILQKVVQLGTGSNANIGRPAFGKTGTGADYTDAWFVGGIPQLVASVWVGFPQGRVPMTYPTVRIPRVTGGSWPAQIWRVFMVNATEGMRIEQFPRPEVNYVTVRVDALRGCLANRYTPPYLIQEIQYIAGTEPTEVCTEPSSYEPIGVPSLVGLTEAEARDLLRWTGFQVAVETEVSDQPEGTVVAQDPPAGHELLMASTVTIVVAVPAGGSGAPRGKVVVPDVVGLTRDEAVAALQAVGLEVSVILDTECAPADEGCEPEPGLVWKQSADPGTRAPAGSTIAISVEP
ncbi:MAG: transglycosylase domain-containing protein [Actinobacteria bacterium]|nr:transglycosylase domain-containing protein [Actinomycetota bacterium]